MGSLEGKVAAIAATQGGRFTSRQAKAVGLTQRMIDRRVQNGVWVREGRGNFRLAGVPPSSVAYDGSHLMSLPGVVVSHQSAAREHGFPFIPDGPTTVTVRSGTTHQAFNCIVHESTDLAALDCELRGGTMITNPERTVIDLAAVLRPKRFALVLAEVLADEVVSFDRLCVRFDQLARRGKPGTRLLRTRLDDLSRGRVPTESELESRALELLMAAGLPMPELQAPLPWRHDEEGRVDMLYRDARLIIECDSRRWHTRERDFERDRRRDNDAMLAGWRVLRITWDDVRHHPERVVADVRKALGIAA